jgi:ABC-type uncharacterized transport system involved in gliding motility auxiliary subunit
MSDSPKTNPSFSTGNRWRIGLDVVLRTVLVLAVVVMVNYLAARFFHRFHLSQKTHRALSSSTLNVLRSLTNRVDITLYYDREADFYEDVKDLANEYLAASGNISVQTVDYNRDPALAESVKAKYQPFFASQSDKDLVIFDYGGRVKVVPGDTLAQYKMRQVVSKDPKEKLVFDKEPQTFNGEQAFTSTLLALSSPQPLKAYFLQGDGEASLTETSIDGYRGFAETLAQNYFTITDLTIGNAGVPTDCSLLIIAGPRIPLSELEIQQISQYLQEGGKLLVMFDFRSRNRTESTGLESMLLPWGVQVVRDSVQDLDNSGTQGYDIIVSRFGKHPVVDSLSQQRMQIYLPCPIFPVPSASHAANAPEVTPLFGTMPSARLLQNSGEPPRSYPLACAIEKKPVVGETPPRGNARIIVVGDDAFLGNYYIKSGGNREFLSSALNWLGDRPLLVAGIGPRPVTDLRIQITRHEQRELNWLLLGVLPGAVLIFGWFVWLVRRK